MSNPTKRPIAVRLDDPRLVVAEASDLSPEDRSAAVDAATAILEPEDDSPQRNEGAKALRARRWRWGAMLTTALAGLMSLAVALAVEQLIGELFARNDWLGWTGLGLVGIAALAFVGLIGRELAGLLRLRRIDRMRRQADETAASDDRKEAIAVCQHLIAFYRDRPDTARGRAALGGHLDQIIDGTDLIRLAEREILQRLDDAAREMIMQTAKRVSVITAVSPRALIDVGYVLYANTRMVRQMSLLYGGRPGALGFWSLMRQIGAHLALTGGMAVGDSVVQQLVGHGVAAKVSARLGEGVVNGLLTARVGLSAIHVCRPLPFVASSGPNLRDVVGNLLSSAPEDAEPAENATPRARRT